jgi:formylglycine-generating enzyme required for sulfatase activity
MWDREALIKELGDVRERGIVRIESPNPRLRKLHLPVLREIVSLSDPSSGAFTRGVESLLRKAIEHLPDGLAKATATRIYGLDSDLFEAKPDVWRAEARRLYPAMGSDEFRKGPELEVLGLIASEIISVAQGSHDDVQSERGQISKPDTGGQPAEELLRRIDLSLNDLRERYEQSPKDYVSDLLSRISQESIKRKGSLLRIEDVGGRRMVSRADICTLEQAISQERRLLLVGPSGIGKSWLARQAAASLLREGAKMTPRIVPILIDLGHFNIARTLEQLAVQALKARWDSDLPLLLPELMTQSVWDNFVLLLILDNANRLPAASEEQRIEHLMNLISMAPSYAHLVVVGTDRIYADILDLVPFELGALSSRDVKLLLTSCVDQFGLPTDSIWQHLDPELLRLCHVPFYLRATIAALIEASQHSLLSINAITRLTIDDALEVALSHAIRNDDRDYYRAALSEVALAAILDPGPGIFFQAKRVIARCPRNVEITAGRTVEVNYWRVLEWGRLAGIIESIGDPADAVLGFRHELIQSHVAAYSLTKYLQYQNPRILDVLKLNRLATGIARPPEARRWRVEISEPPPSPLDHSALTVAQRAGSETVKILLVENPLLAAEAATLISNMPDGTLNSIVKHLRALMADSGVSTAIRIRAGDLLSNFDQTWMAERVAIPGGNYKVGTAEADMFGHSGHEIRAELPSFSLSSCPVTRAQYASFVESGGYDERALWTDAGWQWLLSHDPQTDEKASWFSERATSPATGISWHEATAYCRWAGGRLPTETEWEVAASLGARGKNYYWGEDFSEAGANARYGPLAAGRSTPVGAYPLGITALGLKDLFGNVWEWCMDEYSPAMESQSPNAIPYSSQDRRSAVLRGGCFWSPEHACRLRTRFKQHVGYRLDVIGFRVAW